MLDFIVNPIAGGKHGKKTRKTVALIENILKQKRIEYCLHITHYRMHALNLTKTLIERGATDIIVVGGDGTLHEVVNGFGNFENVNFGVSFKIAISPVAEEFEYSSSPSKINVTL